MLHSRYLRPHGILGLLPDRPHGLEIHGWHLPHLPQTLDVLHRLAHDGLVEPAGCQNVTGRLVLRVALGERLEPLQRRALTGP